jgi:2-keto-4-pentenoate hydratase/2-oxohepta-3-ene-1,7-dioic acid hydratase in catechol pathway
MGPAIVTTDELGGSEGVHNLAVKCFLNGEEVQNSTTAQMVHGVEACVAWISTFMTLAPGDVIFTGTPPGVGCFRTPQLWLKAGDEVTVEIEKIGSVTNRVAAVADTDRGASALLKRLNPEKEKAVVKKLE